MFLEIDKYAHLTDATLKMLQAATAEELERFYIQDRREQYAENFGHDAEEVADMEVFKDGTAVLNGRKFSGGASFNELFNYIHNK